MASTRTYKKSCSTKKGRDAMMKEAIALVEKYGLKHETRTYRSNPREIGLRFVIGQYACSFSFNGDTSVDSFLGHWHTEFVKGWRDREGYPPEFCWTIGGTINTITYSKATTYAETFEAFLGYLEAGIVRLKEVLEEQGLPIVQELDDNIFPEGDAILAATSVAA